VAVRAGAAGLLVALLVAIAVVRLTREPSLPPPPYDAAELGEIPVPNEPWQSIVAAERDWLAVDEETLLRDQLDSTRPDHELALDRAGVVAALASIERSTWVGVEARVDGTFTGAPIVDGCAGPADDCGGLVFMRAAKQADIVALSRWAQGDRAGAARLLRAVMLAAMGLARTGRDAMAQVVGLAMLAHAVTAAFVLDRSDRAEGATLDPALAETLREMSLLEVDLGRGWVGESLGVDPALRHVLEHSEWRTRLFFDEGSAARAIYDTHDACVAFARGEAPSPPPMVDIPGVTADDVRIAPLDALGIIDAVPLECARVIDVAQTHLRTSRDRAQRILQR
jgi:hypothetical protein